MPFFLPKAPANIPESLYSFPLSETSSTYLVEFTEAYLTQFSPGNLLRGISHSSQTNGSSIHFNSSTISRSLLHSSPPFPTCSTISIETDQRVLRKVWTLLMERCERYNLLIVLAAAAGGSLLVVSGLIVMCKMEKHWSSRRGGDCPSGRARIFSGNCAMVLR
ncbi:hypothetical protein NA56DRAFT_121174 [Hyaloscypha hepaticicola]|uniref:Uncharacterized protein n=1 Tax=Hyaloscypha hepaticicola TaxID=2082293 RepID=A0A2J6Q676_9HELO|nr:hypothetical protein NA56DRAFT_121174 [Hyaloscypha hepaticicola]